MGAWLTFVSLSHNSGCRWREGAATSAAARTRTQRPRKHLASLIAKGWHQSAFPRWRKQWSERCSVLRS